MLDPFGTGCAFGEAEDLGSQSLTAPVVQPPQEVGAPSDNLVSFNFLLVVADASTSGDMKSGSGTTSTASGFIRLMPQPAGDVERESPSSSSAADHEDDAPPAAVQLGLDEALRREITRRGGGSDGDDDEDAFSRASLNTQSTPPLELLVPPRLAFPRLSPDGDPSTPSGTR